MAGIRTLFSARDDAPIPGSGALLDGFSIEVTPRAAGRIPDFRPLLPAGTRVYIAHIDGASIDDMVGAAARLRDEGFEPMPHFPARLIADAAMLKEWIGRYQDAAGVEQALLVAGGVDAPRGAFSDTMRLLETGLFDKAGFTRIHVAGHPEGNRDIDPDGAGARAMAALRWKADFARRTDARMAIVTQFCFEAAPVIAWADRLSAEGIDLPIHIGTPGPANPQTLIRFALACGVGPSLRVLQRRAADVTKLAKPFTPRRFLEDLTAHKAANPDFNIEKVHFFPLGGIAKAAEFARNFGGRRRTAAGR